MTPIEFSVTLTENDIARLHDEVRPYWKAITPFAYVGIALGIGAGFLDQWRVAAWLILGGLWLIFAPIALKKFFVRQFRRGPGALETIRYEFADDRVTITSTAARSEVQWSAFIKRKETPSFLCLFFSPVTGCVIPLSQMASQQVEQLHKLVRDRVPAATGIRSADIPLA